MITKSKVTEIFCIADDFCKEFDAEMAKRVQIQPTAPSERIPKTRISLASAESRARASSTMRHVCRRVLTEA